MERRVAEVRFPGVIARAAVVAETDGRGGTRLTRLRSASPVALRSTPDGLYVVGAAAGPLGGDDLALEIEVGPGAHLTVRSAAATVVLPGAGGRPSTFVVSATVAAGGSLHWLPEPVVVAAGCIHRMVTRLALEEGAAVICREEIMLGRHGEASGSLLSRTSVDIGGTPLLRQELSLGAASPGSDGPAVLDGARSAGTLLIVEPSWATAPPSAAVLGPGAAVLPLAGPAVQVSAVADDAVRLRAMLDEGAALVYGRATGTASGRGLSQGAPRAACGPAQATGNAPGHSPASRR